MFEQELEMEKRESTIVPLLLIVGLILSIVTVAGYYLIESRKVLSHEDAVSIVNASLKELGPATLQFHTGMVKASVNEKPHDPHYRLLEKAGLVTLGKDTGTYKSITPIALTQQGQSLLGSLNGVEKTKEKDGTDLYTVPVAERKLVEVSKITMNGASRATVDFSWKWEPNKLGNLFDASGTMVKSFNTWDRATLIQKYGVSFYHAEPTRVTLSLVKTVKGWQTATE